MRAWLGAPERSMANPRKWQTTRAALLFVFLSAVAALAGGCGVGPDRVQIRSIERAGDDARASLEARPTIVAYRTQGETNAEILATDLSIEDLDPANGFVGVRGQITRLRMFTRPIAGRTPVSNSAGNAVVQHVVINDGVLAVYGGAGLLRPGARPGANPLSVVLRDGTLRLTRSNGPVADPIGTARVDLGLTASLDAAMSRLIAARLDQIIEMTQPLRPDEDDR